MNDNIVFLAFSNPNKTEPASTTHLACTACKNLTFIVQQNDENAFPTLICAVCRMHIGRIGWAE